VPYNLLSPPNVLELAVSVVQHDVIAHMFNIREVTIHNSSDNMATLWWQRNGATSNIGHMACLFRLQALRQRHYQYVPTFDYIVGGINSMVYDCSGLWHLMDVQLRAFLNDSFPQILPWQLSQLRKTICSTLTWPCRWCYRTTCQSNVQSLDPLGHIIFGTRC
jgi:hypothetical protein